VLVELAFDDEPFQLSENDADLVVHLRATSDHIMFQKERLMNLGLRALPASCSKVVFLDGDAVFSNPRWVSILSSMLDTTHVVQPYNCVSFMKEGQLTPSPAQYGECWNFNSGILHRTFIEGHSRNQAHPGYAFAVQRAVVNEIGLFDFDIMGSGDMINAAGWYNSEWAETYIKRSYPAEFIVPFSQWVQAARCLANRNATFLEQTIAGIWHGEVAERNYDSRPQMLKKHHFDPLKDIKLDVESGGAFGWSSDKPSFQDYVRTYFQVYDKKQTS